MKVLVTWEFDSDVEDFDPEFIDIPGLAKDLAKRELQYLLEHNAITADEFEYIIATD